jgi:hypothetical protein
VRTLAFSLVFLFAWQATADEGDVATAEALFQDGRALLEAGRASEACPKLAESQRLDPATGTLIALAACHELQGKLASAWAEFSESAGRAVREGRADRSELATRRAEQLRPRLSWLTIQVSPSLLATPGIELRRGGRVLGSAALNVPVPVDGGEYVIEAAAPGRQSWRGLVQVGPEADHRSFRVPELAPAAPEPRNTVAADPQRRRPVGQAAPNAEGSQKWGNLEWIGVGSAAAGVLSLGTGAWFLNRALSKNSEADPHCPNNRCDDAGRELRNDALKSGRWATGFAIAGGSLVAVGATLFFVGRSTSKERAAVAFGFDGEQVRAGVTGAF